jgi:hypothetical protein
MIDDIELGAYATHELAKRDPNESDRGEDWIGSLRNLIQEEDFRRKRSGDELYESMVQMESLYAQQAFLGKSAISLPVLAWLYGRPERPFTCLCSTLGRTS